MANDPRIPARPLLAQQIGSFGTPSPVTAQKQASLETATRAKEFLVGSPFDMAVANVAVRNENRLGNAELVQDLEGLNDFDFAQKYGIDALNQRHRYDTVSQSIGMVENANRDAGEIVTDTLGSAGKALNSFALDTASLGAGLLVDKPANSIVSALQSFGVAEGLGRNPVRTSEAIGAVKQGIDQAIDSTRSRELRESTELDAIRSSLDAADNQAQYAEDLASGRGRIASELARFGRGFSNRIDNLAENPIVALDVTTQSAGYMAGLVPAVRKGASMLAAKELSKRGLTKADITKDAYQALLADKAKQVVPVVVGVTEAGGSFSENQLEVLAMDEAELADSPAYQDLRSQNYTHEEARSQIALNQGLTGAAFTLPAAYLSGKIGTAFEANPLAVAGSGLVGRGASAAKNIGLEVVEEAIQGANSQLAGKAAEAFAQGVDVDYGEGLGEVVAESTLAAAGMATGLQAPGVALGAAGQAAKATGAAVAQAAGKVSQARQEAAQARTLEGSGVTSEDLNTAAQDAEQALTEIIADRPAPAVAEPEAQIEVQSEVQPEVVVEGQTEVPVIDLGQTTPQQIEALQTPQAPQAPQVPQAQEPESDPLVQPLEQALTLTEDEIEGFSAAFPAAKAYVEEAASQGRAPSRPAMVNALSQSIEDPALEPEQQMSAAINTVMLFQEMANADSDAVRTQYDALPEDSLDRRRVDRIRKSIDTLSSSPALQKARDRIKELDFEKVSAIIPQEALKDETLPDNVRKGLIDAIRVIGELNPSALSPDMPKAALNQLDAMQKARKYSKNFSARQKQQNDRYLQKTKKSLQTLDRLQERVIVRSQEAKQKIEESQTARIAEAEKLLDDGEIIESFDGKPLTKADLKPIKTSDVVREEIRSSGNNGGKLPSLSDHASGILGALDQGQVYRAALRMRSLRRFAQSQLNKLEAFNESAASGDGKGRDYMAWNGVQEYLETAKRTAVHLQNPASVALAQDVHADTDAAVQLFNLLSRDYGDLMDGLVSKGELDALPEPLLHENVSRAANSVYAPKKVVEQKNDQLTQGTERAGDGGSVSGNGRDTQKAQEPEAERSSAGAARADEPAEGRAAPEASEAVVSDNDAGPTGDQRTGRAESKPGDATRTDVRGDDAGQQGREAEEDPESDLGDDDADADTASDDSGEAERAERAAAFKSTFGSLLGAGTGFNRFLKAFKPRRNKPLLVAQERVVSHIIENIEDLSKISQSKLSRPLTLEEQAGVVRMLQVHVPELVKSLNAEVQKVLTEGGQNRTQNGVKSHVSYSEMVESDPQALSFQNLLTLNLAEKLEDGTYRLHPKAAGAMSLAALEWLMANQDNLNRARVMKKSDVAEALGEETLNISEDLVRAFNEGIPHKFLVEDMASKFSRLLGISPESSASQSDTQGIPQALAASMIEIMADKGWVTIPSVNESKFTIPLSNVVKKDGKPADRIIEIRAIRVNESSSITNDLKLLKNQPDVFSTVLSPEAEKTRYVGEAPERVEPYKINSKTNKISSKERAVVERLQKMEHKLNLPLWNFVNAFSDLKGEKPGQSVFNYALGYRTIGKDINMAPSVLESQKGKNQALMSQLTGVRAYVEDIMAHAADGKDPSEVPVFFKFMISSVGRLQQQGLVTPQGSKIMRELINPTRAVLDLTKQEQDGMFWLAVAQSVGQKTEAKNHATVIAETKAMFEEGSAFTDALNIIADWYERSEGGAKTEEKLTHEEQVAYLQAIRQAVDPADMTMKVQHALLEVVRYNFAKDQGGEAFSRFQSQLALEADGKTDGPINAFMHMMTGGFSEEQITLMNSGGLFFSNEYTTLNDYYDGPTKGTDAYTKAAENLKTRLLKEGRNTSKPAVARDHFQALMRIMLALQANMEIATNEENRAELKIARNLLKNPLTVFFYGAGDRGIAGKIADAILTTFNEKLPYLSKTMDPEQLQTLMQDLDKLLGTAVIRFKGDLQHYPMDPRNGVAPHKLLSRYKTLELTQIQKNNLRDAVQHYFIPHAVGAINDTMGKELKQNMVMMQEVSAMQAKVFHHLFTQRLEARLKELKSEEKLYPSQYLPESEVRKIFEETQKHAPIYETDAQSFMISGAERTDTQKVAGKSLRGQLQTTVKSDLPSEPSVKVSPYMIIGTGDGRMVLNIYLKQDGSLDVSLPVFDGVEMAADQIYTASGLINEAVLEGWMQGNIFGSIREGYERFLTTFDKDEVPIDMLSDNIKTLLGKKPEAGVTREDLIKVRDKLRQAEHTNLARKRAIKRIKTWTDHMASARTPFESKGEPVAQDQVLAKLNEFYEEELSKLEGIQEAKAKLLPQAKDAPWLKAAIEEAGTPVEGSQAKVMNGKQVLDILKNSVNLSREHRTIIGQIFHNAKKLDLSNVTFYFGSRPSLTALRNARFPVKGIDGTGSSVKRGFYDPARRIGYVTSYSAETMLHEMLHALTADVVLRYYADPESLSEGTRKAMQRLEVMMKEFQGLYFDGESRNIQAAAESLQVQLDRLEGEPAAQVLEFIAWGLTNQHIIDVAQKNRVQSRLGKIVGRALRALKELLGFKGRVADDFFSNLRFNAEVVMQAPGLDGVTGSAIPEGFGLNQLDTSRVEHIRRRYMDTLDAFIGDSLDALDAASRVVEQDRRMHDGQRLWIDSRDSLNRARQAGFDLDDAQGQAFIAIHSVMSSEMKLNSAALRRLSQIYDSIVSKLEERHFYADPTGQARDAQEAQEAKLKLAYVQGRTGLARNAAGRTDVLANFLALTQLEDSVRQSLSTLEAPKDVEIEKNSFDDRLTSIAESAVNAMVTRSIDPKGLSPNALAQLDQLTLVLADLKAQTNLSKLNLFSKVQNWADDKMAEAILKTANFIHNKAKQKADGLTSSAAQLAYRGVQFTAGIASTEKAEAEASVLTRFLNQKESLHTWRNLAKDVIGRTMENAPIFDLINRAKAEIQAIRQTHREDIPRNLAKKFSRTLKKEEWSSIHKGIGKMDLLALARADIIPLLLDPTSVSTSLQAAEEALSQQVNNRSLESRYKAHANALATFMVTGESVSNHLFTNAYAIAAEAGTQRQARIPDSALVDAIDKYVSLKAFELLDAQTKEQLKELAENETDGLDALISTLDTAKRLEEKKLEGNPQAEMLKLNAHKGYIPETISDGVRVVVADVRDQEQLVRRGYTKVADYTGDRDEDYRGRRAVYISTVAGKAAYKQGVAQTVHDTYMGADGRNGTTHGGITGGVLKGSDAQYVLGNRGRINASLAPGEYLRPVFNEQHEVVAYEMHIKPEHKTAVRKDTHAGRMIGAWTGRISEETAARAFNTELVVALKEIWDRDKNTRESEFVNLADPNLKDPIYKDAWKTLSWHIKDDAAEIFGRGKFFPVRRDMIEDAVGYRAAALTDSWTGVSRWSDTTQKVMRKTAETIFQEKAFKYLRQAEDGVTGLVSYAKTTIVIRSIKVILGNFFSNYGHLMMRGMDPITIAKAMKNKFIETDQYLKNQADIQLLTAEAAIHKDNPHKSRSLRARIRALQEANEALSIWPLIQAGELSTVSEDITEDDIALRQGRIADYLEGLVDKLPGQLKVLGKNAIVAKDTALFRGLSKGVQFGDFVAKAALYDHLTQKKGMSKEQSLIRISEEFVNYNRLAGRTRDALESFGLMWFYNYKLRIMKVAANTLRENPFSALSLGMGALPALDVDTVIDSNLIGKWQEGNLGYSLGPGMGLHSYTLAPMHQLWTAVTN